MRRVASGYPLCWFSLVVVLLSPSAVLAQAGPGPLRGDVQDQTGAIVPGLPITLVDEAGSVVATTQTTPAGQFVFDRVAPGLYEIHATLTGFKTASTRVRVTAGRTPAPQRLILEVAAVTQEITVGREAPLAPRGNRDAIRLTRN